MNPLKVIRAKCVDCCGGVKSEVDACTATRCPLHPYRMGTNPNRKPRVVSEEQRAAMSARLAQARAARTGVLVKKTDS